MKFKELKLKNRIIAITTYFVLVAINSSLSKGFGLPSLTEWWINTSFLLVFASLLIFTFNKDINTFVKVIIIPCTWLVHAILTVPAAMLLGILMYDPNHLRTAAEHRAVFILAGIPIIIFILKKSKLFSDKFSDRSI